ncbi:hypothetical protein [Halodesulfovibrio sp.]|uniref:hypothetical protein n=1 Tax=Halodesulfovibrio sp. TaxID=1912772 RepID=UPI0025C56566|nr:hypothetical protein [Halodesulfovibrio sp.]
MKRTIRRNPFAMKRLIVDKYASRNPFSVRKLKLHSNAHIKLLSISLGGLFIELEATLFL